MITAAIIDDEYNNVELLQNIIKRYVPQITITGTASSVKEGLDLITQLKPSLVFLDVEMGDGTGFDLLKQLPNIPLKVIFTTAHEKYAVNAFHYSAIDYLIKPISPSLLIAAVKKAEYAFTNEELHTQLNALLDNIKESEVKNKKLVLKNSDRIYAITISDVIRFESEGNYTTVYLSNGTKIIVSKLLKEFDELLADNKAFIRIHQSHLINLTYLFYYEKSDSSVILHDQTSIPVSSRKKELLFEKLKEL